jgi:putative endonuclease
LLAALGQSEDCRAVALAKADRCERTRRLAASYDSAGQKEMNRFVFARRAVQREDNTPEQLNRFVYVYILQSEADANHFYVGRTQDLRARISRHNAGQVRHTSKWKPWRLKTYIALSDSTRAIALEHYLKSASGRALIKKRL